MMHHIYKIPQILRVLQTRQRIISNGSHAFEGCQFPHLLVSSAVPHFAAAEKSTSLQ